MQVSENDKNESGNEKYLVTSALPYANGPIHIGHLAGAYLPADEYVRYLRAKGEDVLFVCGTDEHGTPIEMKARNEDKEPEEVVDKYYEEIKDSFDAVNMSFDIFSRTSKDIHHKTSQDFFSRLKQKGLMDKKGSVQLYCENDEMFLPDRYVNGVCPYCGAEDQRGDQCEECGHVLDPDELKDPYCALCEETPVEKQTEHFYFELSNFQQRLEDWIDKNDHWRKTTKNMVNGWLDEGLQDRCITRDIDWGITLPAGEDQDKTLYVWFEAPIGYLSFTKELTDDWKDYWLTSDNETKLIHFIGKDNVPFHAIIWPAMLMGYENYEDGKEFVLPWMVPSNEHLNLEGRQFSTSRDWAIWIDDFLEDYPADYLRYYITAIAPEKRDTNYRWDDFQSKINDELADIYGNFVHRALTFTQNYFDGEIPEPKDLKEEDQKLLKEIENTKKSFESNMEKFKFKDSLKEIIKLAKEGNSYFDQKKPWKSIEKNKEDTARCISLSLRLVKSLAILSHPFIPDSSEKIWDLLNEKDKIEGAWAEIGAPLEAGRNIKEPEVLFEKIEDSQVEKEKRKLKEQSGSEEEELKEEEKMTVSFDDFQKMDIKIGKVLEVEDIEEADNLYKIVVDLGIEKRVLVAGLKDHYSRSELKGKKISVLTNLESKEMFGIKSQGMLLAAEDEENGVVSLLSPDKEVEEGSEIH